jgi:hypothetical protein
MTYKGVTDDESRFWVGMNAFESDITVTVNGTYLAYDETEYTLAHHEALKGWLENEESR